MGKCIITVDLICELSTEDIKKSKKMSDFTIVSDNKLSLLEYCREAKIAL